MMKRQISKKIVPASLYRKFVQSFPICCVDTVIKSNKKFLLVQRKQNPAKNKWWLPGGRLLFNEDLDSATKRKLKEELNIRQTKSIKFLGLGETRFRKGHLNTPSHSINVVFLVKIDNAQIKNIKLDSFHRDYKWFIKIPRNSHPYIKKFLKLARFK